jgi:hypothetical protein
MKTVSTMPLTCAALVILSARAILAKPDDRPLDPNNRPVQLIEVRDESGILIETRSVYVDAKEEVYDKDGKLAAVTLWDERGTKKLHGHFGGWHADTRLLWGAAGNLKKDGRWTYWDQNGNIVADGEFRDGKPWEGVCGAVDRSGSTIAEHFGRYEKGKLLVKLEPPN